MWGLLVLCKDEFYTTFNRKYVKVWCKNWIVVMVVVVVVGDVCILMWGCVYVWQRHKGRCWGREERGRKLHDLVNQHRPQDYQQVLFRGQQAPRLCRFGAGKPDFQVKFCTPVLATWTWAQLLAVNSCNWTKQDQWWPWLGQPGPHILEILSWSLRNVFACPPCPGVRGREGTTDI